MLKAALKLNQLVNTYFRKNLGTQDSVSFAGVNPERIPPLECRELVKDSGVYNERLWFQVTFFICLMAECQCQQQANL